MNKLFARWYLWLSILSGLVLISTPAAPGAAKISAAPLVNVSFAPPTALAGKPLRGSAAYYDPDGDAEGQSQYAWSVNDAPVLAGGVPQSLLLPLDGSLLSSSGTTSALQQGLTFSSGRWPGGQALHFDPVQNSRLAYLAQGRLDPRQGTFEAWVRLSRDLNDPLYSSYPRLISLVIDSEHQLYLEVNVGRLLLTTRYAGQYYGTWPSPPNWKAGEWHHLAAAWSAADKVASVYYDCALADESLNFPDLGTVGAAQRFNLGSGANGSVFAADLDDVRLSRRPLSPLEIEAACQRGGPAPNDELLLPPEYFKTGDTLGLAVTPCDVTSACGGPTVQTTSVNLRLLGAPLPASGLLPSGTLSVTLSLTTTQPADCRYALQADIPYTQMPNAFQSGQGTKAHSTLTSGWSDLAERTYYIRCAPKAAPGQADQDEQRTHLRVLGPFQNGFPRIANVWGEYDPAYGPAFFAGYDWFLLGSWGSDGNQAAAIRALNPDAKILLSQDATYGLQYTDPLTKAWWNSLPGDPGYNCLLRDTSQNILLVSYWGHPMYNLLQPYCRDRLVEQSVNNYFAAQPELVYDGIYWDRLQDSISWLSPVVDSDLNGVADNPQTLDSAFIAGLQNFLGRVRAALPNAVLMGNDANQEYYDTWVNGRLFEWQLASLLEENRPSWEETVTSYLDWNRRGYQPHLTLMESSPERLFEQKYTFQGLDAIPPAMLAEAQAAYPRMRFGLATTLMGDGLFSFDYGPDWHGNLWWYDEFGAPTAQSAGFYQQPHGYLGQPSGPPFLLQDRLPVPNQLTNPGFENDLAAWQSYVHTASGAAATFGIQAGVGISGTQALLVDVQTPGPNAWTVELNQLGLGILQDQEYTVSFWGRCEITGALHIGVSQQTAPWTGYGLESQATLTPTWKQFHLHGVVNTTTQAARLQFFFGAMHGKVWLDDIQFQAGALGVWARPFTGGLAVINTTSQKQTLPLPGRYQKIWGQQAPLYAFRLDDDQAAFGPEWMSTSASANQFGQTIHTIPPGSQGSVIYSASLPYAGEYQVLLWVAPAAGLANAMPVTVISSAGQSSLTIDLSGSGEPGWQSLGTYTCPVGSGCQVRLQSAPTGTAVADAVKWESTARFNDGSPVSILELQPMDGIVLVKPAAVLYLPALAR